MREIAAEWAAEKEVERQATENRRILEDEMVKSFVLQPDLDSTVTKDIDGYVIKITGRIDRKVDADKIQELAAQNGLESHLSTLCRWKPELNITIWKNTDPKRPHSRKRVGHFFTYAPKVAQPWWLAH